LKKGRLSAHNEHPNLLREDERAAPADLEGEDDHEELA